MNLVYCKEAKLGANCELDENEHHHLQVLRAGVGEVLNVFDGIGNLFQCVIVSSNKKVTTIQINQLLMSEPLPQYGLHIAIAPTKNIDRMEWFLEKATEIGIQFITPIICQRSERRELRKDRLEKVVLSAAKQSLHLHLPTVNEALSLKAFLKTVQNAKKYIAFCEERTTHLKDLILTQESAVVLIGPEGDFTTEEFVAAKGYGYIPVSLGESRLRTETAGLMVAAIYNLVATKKIF